MRWIIASLMWGALACQSDEGGDRVGDPLTASKSIKAEQDLTLLDPPPEKLRAIAKELPHPPSPSLWNTKALILAQKLPQEEQLIKCKRESESVAYKATNPETLYWAKDRVKQEIRLQLELYHWCFYHSLYLLETNLSQDGLGVTQEEKLRSFGVSIKSLWILSLALDQTTQLEKPPYFAYLRARYLALSKDYFGRELGVLGEPFNRDLGVPQPKKKAGEAGDL